MNSYDNILLKLSAFIKKYYSKLLIKGVLLFLVLGLVFFFVVLAVEYFLWLNSEGRLALLVAFVLIEAFLLFKYILTPLFYLFRVRRGISKKQAALLIGTHFPEVNDKLYNLLELAEDSDKSELLVASIEQRSKQMSPIPFTKAVNLRENLRYVKYFIVPLVLLGIVWISGNSTSFFGSTERIVNYDMAYEPPAPFEFMLLTNDLDVLDDKAHTILATTRGDVKPETVFITVDGKRMVLQEKDGQYKFVFEPPMKSVEFFFEGNDVVSKKYRLNVLETPSIENFELMLEYPRYTNRNKEVLKSTGNAIFPEGTKVTWRIQGSDMQEIQLMTSDTVEGFKRNEEVFELSKRVYSKLPYELATSNEHVDKYERLAYQFDVIKDAYPSIKVSEVRDSLNPNTIYYAGETSDDYSLKTIRLVYYSNTDEEKKNDILIASPERNFFQFYYTFPSGLDIQEGVEYSYYFEVTDNDAIHGGKSVKSQLFSTKILDNDELRNRDLQSQQSLIQSMDNSLEEFNEQKQALEEINKEHKEKTRLDFNDQRQIKDFLRKQQKQEGMMQKFSQQLKENLNKSDKQDRLNELLKERLERQEIEAKKNEKLLNELNKIADKIDKEELTKRLEEIGKKQQSSQRNLEQLVELTKRYYVTEKAAQLAKDLENLANEQEAESDSKKDEEGVERQKKLNDDFEKLSKEMEELEKDNQDLKKPLQLSMDDGDKEDIKRDQQEASEALEEKISNTSSEEKKKDAEARAGKKQKSAGQKMREMSEKLQESSSGGGGGSTITEDAEMLRQILDNLITFSFKQENLFESLEKTELDISQFSSSIRGQQELRNLFEHIDDSLFALSLRRAELSEFVNEQITEVYYNTDKALESIAENQIFQGVSYQKYVLNAANGLSDFLANILDNMQESMQSGQGEGEGEGFQLPDIIKSQQQLGEKMNGSGKSGEGEPKQGSGKGEKGEGKESGSGEQSGQQGNGKKGQQGNEGDGGSEGEGEENGGEGSRGKQGSSKGSDSGENGQGNGGSDGDGESGEGMSEEELKEIYEIYKEQQAIRNNLEEQLKNMINLGDRKLGEKLARQMEEFENELLENGITQESITKMNTIQYELLKLENAAMKQGKKEERESNTNRNKFSNPIISRPEQFDNYQNEVEILNRQTLPLRENFKTKVKEYFQGNDGGSL